MTLRTGQPARLQRCPFPSLFLPFANLGQADKDEQFADGITETLTTDLARIAHSAVIARNTAFTFKGKAVDARQIGKQLQVKYILEGSVQRSGDRIRVNVQLIDAESGNHLWADRFDKTSGDLLQMQDEIVARVAGALKCASYCSGSAKGRTFHRAGFYGFIFPRHGMGE